MRRPTRLLTLTLSLLDAGLTPRSFEPTSPMTVVALASAEGAPRDELAPMPGSVLLGGSGELSSAARAGFVDLAGGAALAVHGGRRIAVLGASNVGFAIYRPDGAMADEQVLPAQSERDLGDPLAYRLDLLSWIRQARAAERPLFPRAALAAPTLARGALVLSGGGVSDAIWARFIELAGGKAASIVCIPSALAMDDDAAPQSFSAHELEQRGCTSVSIVHIATRDRAHHDPRLLDAIASADGVWIDGGRTYRLMDRFGETEAARANAAVLARGGVVGGSSAGCQVLGEFLVRGDPKSNDRLTDPGYLEGLGLLPGVILDAHFRERQRGPAFSALVRDHPQYLGLDVDADTALVLRGSVSEVLGEGGVVVYDGREGRTFTEVGLVLERGAKFDLAQGAILE